MGRKKKRCCSSYKHWSSSSGSSSSDDISIDETTNTTRPTDARRNNSGKKEDEVISMLTKLMDDTRKLTESHNDLCKRLELRKDDIIEIRKQLDKLTESQSDQCKRLEKFAQCQNELRMQLDLHPNVTSGDKSAALRSQSNQQIPRYELIFKNWKIGKYVEKDHNIEISIALVEKNNGQTVESGPLASATVELVVVDAQFNKHGNQYSWSREEFESSIIKKAQQGNSVMRDTDQSLKSIVSNGQFNLAGGLKIHNDSTIFSNSSNKKIRLGVMVVSATEERVLEGLSNPFYVRGHDRPARQSMRSNSKTQALVDNGHQEQIGTMHQLQNPLSSENSTLAAEISPVIIGGQLQHPFQQEQPALTQQYQGLAQATYNQTELLSVSDCFTGLNAMDSFFCDPGNGTQFDRNEPAFPVHLIWDRPNVEPSKNHWNMLDQLKPLKWVRLTSEHFGSLTIVSKEAMQTRRQGGVLIESLDPDDSDEELPLKRKLHNRYRLRFVNKVSEAYYTWEQIKAYDGKLLKVALFDDENNTRITSGPLSSASVEVVALHGDFDVHGQDYWTPEEFSRCVVCPQPGKEASVLGGDRFLVLADGEACLGETFFQRTSFCARTGMFKLGVMLASAQAERIQEGISKPFLVNDRPLAVFGGKDTTTHEGTSLPFSFFLTKVNEEERYSMLDIPQDVYNSVVLEYIIQKSVAKNVVTLIQGHEPVLGSTAKACVRRLSIQSSTKERFDELDEDKSALRSLTMFKTEPSDLQRWKMLRILDLEGCNGLDQEFFDGLCELLLLKYLNLRKTRINKIPSKIEKLQRLETLDIRETKVERLPMQVIMLPKLAYLFGKFQLPEVPKGKEADKLYEFLKKKSALQTLAGFVINNRQSPEHVILLASKLKKVKVWCNDTPADAAMRLFSDRELASSSTTASERPSRRSNGCPRRSGNTRVLSQDNIDFIKCLKMRVTPLESVSIISSEVCNDFLGSLEGLCTISSIKLRGILNSLPDSNKLSELGRIKKLQLFSTGLTIKDLSALQGLRGLEYLKLVEHTDRFCNGVFIVEKKGFESLKILWIDAPKVPNMQFKEGSMRSLTSLYLLCPNSQMPSGIIEGISHLANLSEVILHSSMQQAWEAVANGHPNRPCVKRQPAEPIGNTVA